MKSHQNNKCKICEKEFQSKWDTVVDHCHTTNKVRGLLCRNCNLGIGLLKDNPEFLKRAILHLVV